MSNEESMKAGDALDHDGDEREGTAARAASKASPAKAADDEAGEEREDDAQAEGEGSDAVDGEAAGRVARALGVGDEAEGEGANAEGEAAEAEAAPTNRAARRREEALKRRRKKAAGAPADSDEELPRDKNARAKEMLLRRREQAAEREAAVTSGLLPGEMVDDALARMTSASMKWLRRNLGAIQWVALAAILATAGGLTWNWRSEKKSGAASSELASAIADEHGRVMPEDKRTDEEKEYDFARVFKTPEERSDAALAAYEKVAAQEPGSGASILAKLGIAGVELEKRDYAKALDAYAVVLSSKLAAADADVKARALEGTGFAKEGKGDLDGALASFKELQGIDAKGFKELGMYHEARVLVAKGDKAKAEQLLKAVRDKLQAPTPDGSKPFRFLEATVDRKLLELDPTAVPRAATPAPGGGAQLTPEQIELLKKQFQKAAQDAAKQKQQQGGQ